MVFEVWKFANFPLESQAYVSFRVEMKTTKSHSKTHVGT